KGYGHDFDGKPITEKSLMRSGSVSKSFTAFAVLQLVAEGNIKLDAPVVNYLTKFKLDSPNWNQDTIRHLLSHTAGILSPIIVSLADTLKEGVECIKDWKLQSQPGEKHTYSNGNYWVLTFLVEKVSGIKFSDYLKQKVFSPLEMDHSFTVVNS